ncbi:Alpha/Beta hydrolase protein [Durotheca rogersii]|uniref:Alpha/Beta hydrolase protein n=1 Tax=Durotheca rogersii TaxID=419775 RepID=UPI002220A01D|nr:Alpha/Beta hydrolase protein [Durotheca rogersii]KAI5861151.1 Alpha/Beta hydrolase protein [Durotheca rogersii]
MRYTTLFSTVLLLFPVPHLANPGLPPMSPEIWEKALKIRREGNAGVEAASQTFPYPEDLIETTHSTTSADGATVEIARFLPRAVEQDNSGEPHRAVLYIFGGGLIAGSVAVQRPFIATIASQSQTQVFATHYRIAPENPYPAAIDDVYATLLWLHENAASLNIDPARIVVLGPSAGGGLAASLTLLARDRGLNPPIAAQVLRYPMLDDRTYVNETDPRWSSFTWTLDDNITGWTSYLSKIREGKSDCSIPYHASPARAKDLRGLPPTLISVGDLDLFRDEDAAFANRLSKADVDVHFDFYPDVPHGFDLVYSVEAGQRLRDAEVAFFQRF